MARFITRMADQCRQRAAEDRFLRRFAMKPVDADEAEDIGPGWYDSSRELESGLLVHEGAPGDALLAEWHEACRLSIAPALKPAAQASLR